jgi:hypothetical protein
MGGLSRKMYLAYYKIYKEGTPLEKEAGGEAWQ